MGKTREMGKLWYKCLSKRGGFINLLLELEYHLRRIISMSNVNPLFCRVYMMIIINVLGVYLS